MIPNQWYVVLESREVPRRRPVGVTRMGEKMVFWRKQNGEVVCQADRCPHLSAQLSPGKLREDDRLACPFHGFEFDSSGACQYIPAQGRGGTPPKAMRVRAYPTFEARGFIWIFWGETAPAQPPRFFDDFYPGFTYSGWNELWPVHYSRMVENQLDVLHLTTVHYDSIGRGGRSVVDGPIVRLENDKLQVWVSNRKDDGTPPRKPEELPEPTRPPFLEFIYPNLWQNRISDDLRILAAFVPVDETHGRLYIRFYQRIVRVPVLRQIFNWAGKLGSQHITAQDRRVVSTQDPKRTDLKIGEKPQPEDRILLTYRRRRRELIEAAERG